MYNMGGAGCRLKIRAKGGVSFLILFFFCISCGNDPLNVDVSDIMLEPVKIRRFDRDFFALREGNTVQQLPALQKAYPGFAELYVRNILCPVGVSDSACIPEITRFVNDKDMKEAFDFCQSAFSEADIKSLEEQLTEIFRRHKYYFPRNTLPGIIAMMSGFNYSVAAADSIFAIGLEMYLGKKNKFYEMLQFPSYKQQTMQKEFIPVDVLRAWMVREFPNPGKSGTLLNEMIYFGKLLYLSDAMIPAADDTLKIGFTKKQLDWCVDHEKDIWGYLIENKFLYSTELDVIAKFTGEGPFTTGFVKESPARTGTWIGWKIVRKYMENNPKVALEELMREGDAQKVLAMSKYKP